MPIYDFACQDCSHNFECRLKVDDRDSAQKCPQCGSQKTKRLFGGFMVPKHHGIHFKSQVEWGKKAQKHYPRSKPKYAK